ncbi:aldo/keto reductase [Shimia sagamensis]|uniref:Predicted oxidoreductase n=1 Tax=Shimia sagamensis TaxID=1566352 RepID=A0ABY1NU90_9RHOB|nr:aldo/keto reductase [Shimia sagamensis]SMP18381.1 Predicted oxidoreductase [Shimia sagamensis]
MTQTITSPNGTPISRYAFGTMQFGGTASERDSIEMFDACLAAGITHFDTAFLYTDGRSEEILGTLAAPNRDDLVIATKVGYRGGAGAENLRSQFDVSRKRLNMDHVDILYLHRFDAETPIEETLETFAKFKADGKISHVGLSNFAAWQVVKAAWAASKLDLTIDLLQPMYSLVKRQAEVEILPMCADLGILPATYSPLGGGLLTGKYSAQDAQGRLATDERYAARYDVDWMHRTAVQLSELAASRGLHPATLAAAWVAKHKAAPSPILSARNLAQLEPSLAATSFDMDDALYAGITALSQTPAPATDRLDEA